MESQLPSTPLNSRFPSLEKKKLQTEALNPDTGLKEELKGEWAGLDKGIVGNLGHLESLMKCFFNLVVIRKQKVVWSTWSSALFWSRDYLHSLTSKLFSVSESRSRPDGGVSERNCG